MLLAAGLASGGYDGGRLLMRFADPRITESSGIVSAARSDLLFTHNDSGDTARFFAVDRTGRTRATYRLPGVQARDWEDIARGPGPTIWLGDIGDNDAVRTRGLLVHRVAEPVPGAPTRLRPTTFRLRYNDGPRDAEALLIAPRTGQLFIVDKNLGSDAGVYTPTGPLRPGGAVNLLRRVAQVPVPEVTGGDISPDGRRLVLRNYTAAYEWDVAGGNVVAALANPPTRIPLPPQQQGEGIAYSRDGRSLIISSEGVGAPVFVLHRLPSVRAASPRPTASLAVEPAVAPAARRGYLLPALLALVVAIGGALVLLRRRG